jgi:hypothetical protein
MTSPGPRALLDEVLDAFAVEPAPGRKTLEHYLRRYPQFASALIDLSREISRGVPIGAPLPTVEDEAWIDSAWRRHLEADPIAVTDPFATLEVDQLRNVAKTLTVPRQVITAFRDRKVILASVPRRFLGRLAAAVNTSLDALVTNLSVPASVAPSRSYKAEVKPSETEPVTFERVLIDAGVPEEQRARLLAESD